MSDRAVFDCMVYLQAAANESSPAFACFRLVDDGQVTLCVSAAVIAEAREVLNRPALPAKFPHLTPERVQAFLENAQAKAVMFTDVPHVFSDPRDPEEPYLNLAIAASAQYLVSRDKDLLDLMNDAGFRDGFPSLALVDPVAFLREQSRKRQSLSEEEA